MSTTKPILFSGPMVRALLGGRKTQTRRLIKPQPVTPEDFAGHVRCAYIEPHTYLEMFGAHRQIGGGSIPAMRQTALRYGFGNLLWVREAWCPANSDNGPVLCFAADLHRRYLVDESYPVDYGRFPAGRAAWTPWAADVERGTTKAWRPGIHLPRWASRLTLEVTDVRVQRLQEISKPDVIAEGVTEREGQPLADVVCGWHEPYAKLWDAINGAGAWDANPWIVALTFKVHNVNIDAFLKESEGKAAA